MQVEEGWKAKWVRWYLIAGDGEGLQLEEDQCEETDDQYYNCHLIVINDADDEHDYRKHKNNGSP